MSTWLVEKVSSLLEARSSRRGFLARTAMAGSAMTVAPASYILRPGTAYAAICNCNGSLCNCGDLCCDGYTEFCCTLYGENRCPPGTAVAGWWKADGSPYCSSGGSTRPRYYSDCNAICGSCPPDGSGFCSGSCFGCGCGCAKGRCDHRKACCTKFRYGQCNQQIPYLGPIVCRVVTCNPPWTWEETCTTVTATDNYTALHNRACLQQSDPTDFLEEEEEEDPDALAKIYTLLSVEDEEMKLLQRPDGSNIWYLLYPNGLLVEVTGSVGALETGGVERVGTLSSAVFNRLVTVNEKVRALLGMNVTHIKKV